MQRDVVGELVLRMVKAVVDSTESVKVVTVVQGCAHDLQGTGRKERCRPPDRETRSHCKSVTSHTHGSSDEEKRRLELDIVEPPGRLASWSIEDYRMSCRKYFA